MCSRFYKFEVICTNAKDLSSDIHQGDELFSVQSRWKQCAFMSLSAILTAQNIPLIDWSKTWSKTTFNNVLAVFILEDVFNV